MEMPTLWSASLGTGVDGDSSSRRLHVNQNHLVDPVRISRPRRLFYVFAIELGIRLEFSLLRCSALRKSTLHVGYPEQPAKLIPKGRFKFKSKDRNWYTLVCGWKIVKEGYSAVFVVHLEFVSVVLLP